MIRVMDIKKPDDWSELYNIDFRFAQKIGRKGKVMLHCENLATFDIETSNGLCDDAGNVHKLNKKQYDDEYAIECVKDRPYQSFVSTCQPVSLMYIWQLAIETFLPPPHAADSEIRCFVGRTWTEFEEFMEMLTTEVRRQSVYGSRSVNRNMENAAAQKSKKSVDFYIFDHNLGFEMGHMANVYNDDFKKKGAIFAREACNPMYVKIIRNKVKVNFRDTVVLTQKSLYKWTHDEKLPVMKLKENEEFYEDILTPDTPIDPERMQYALNDVVSMIYAMDKYRTKYEHTYKIPLTQTGEVRIPARTRLWKEDPTWCQRCCDIEQGYNLRLYQDLIKVFQGGYTHANAMYSGRVIGEGSIDLEHGKTEGMVKCFDFCSSYPGMTRFKIPYGEFQDVGPMYFPMVQNQNPENPDEWWFGKFEFTNVESNLCNSYWSKSKCEELDDPVVDNGRIEKCKRMVIWMTIYDYDTFRRAYSFDTECCVELYVTEAAYMSRELILHILDLFHKKNAWKGLEEFESQLMFVKQQLNAIAYGCAVYKEIGSEVSYGDNGWNVDRDIPLQKFYETMSKKKPEKCFWSLQDGIAIVSAARWCLWEFILNLDSRIVYCDTDSIKGIFNEQDLEFVKKYNDHVKELQDKVANELGFDPDEFLGVNAKGKKKRLGIMEQEPSCELITWGAKKYAEKIIDYHEDGTPYERIIVTVSGLPKDAGVGKIKNLRDFKLNTLWNIEESHKLISHHNIGTQPMCRWVDKDGKGYVSEDKFGIALIPTTFMMKSDEYLHFLLFLLTGKLDDYSYFNDTPKMLL